MAGSIKSLALIIIAVLLMGCLFFINDARPLSSAKLESVDSIAIKSFVHGLFIEAIKDSGPSSGGRGHKAATIAETMEENKTGGPSSGGRGHKGATIAETIEENKTDGPSSGGRGHEAITDEMLEENKRSGPSTGNGN